MEGAKVLFNEMRINFFFRLVAEWDYFIRLKPELGKLLVFVLDGCWALADLRFRVVPE